MELAAACLHVSGVQRSVSRTSGAKGQDLSWGAPVDKAAVLVSREGEARVAVRLRTYLQYLLSFDASKGVG